MQDLFSALRTLLQSCDGAHAQDGQGFNKFDAPIARDLAPRESLSPRQQRAAWNMLRKYKGQLAAAGIDYDAIPEPPALEGSPKPPRRLMVSEKGNFVFAFAYDATLVYAVKELPGRRFNPDEKNWTVPATVDSAEKIIRFALKHGFEYADRVIARIDELAAEIEQRAANVDASRAADADFSVEGLGGTLRPFQRAGVAYALRQQRTFIADEMGLGKTVQALATLHAANAYPALIVCPASLKLNWKREAEKWLPGKSISVLNGGTDHNYDADIVILNYDILKKHAPALKEKKFVGIVYDESHYCKNYKAQRTEAAKELARSAKYRLALTGTPLLNRPQELLSQLQILGRLNDVGGFWEFAKRYCGAYKGRYGWDFSGAAHLDELNQKMRSVCYIRRNKADVLTELPEKQRANIALQIDNRRDYARAETELIEWLKDRAGQDAAFLEEIAAEAEQAVAGIEDPDEREKARRRYVNRRKTERAETAAEKARRAEQLVRIEALKQLAAAGKLTGVREWVSSFVESDKLVLFASHVEIQKALLETFPGAAHIFGEDSAETRQSNVDRFQNDPECKLIVCSLAAAGVGITLTAASNVAFVEFGWNPAAHDQAEDRCHRIGQKNQVTAWYLIAEDTIDGDIISLIEAKRQVVDAATDGETVTGEKANILSSLVESLKKR